jgi:hypothetical protein
MSANTAPADTTNPIPTTTIPTSPTSTLTFAEQLQLARDESILETNLPIIMRIDSALENLALNLPSQIPKIKAEFLRDIRANPAIIQVHTDVPLHINFSNFMNVGEKFYIATRTSCKIYSRGDAPMPHMSNYILAASTKLQEIQKYLQKEFSGCSVYLNFDTSKIQQGLLKFQICHHFYNFE